MGAAHSARLWACEDVLILISSYLDHGALRTCSSTSRSVRVLLERSRPRCYDFGAAPPYAVAALLPHLPATLLSLNLHGYRAADLGAVLTALTARCRRIEVLNVQHCEAVDSACLEAVATHLGASLRELSVWDAGHGKLSKTALLHLADSCRSLEVLDLRGQRQVDDEVLLRFNPQRLTQLSLAGTAITAHGYTAVVAGSPRLSRMGCMQVGQTHLRCEHISGAHVEQLQLGYSSGSMWLDFANLPNLRFLGVSGCEALENLGRWEDLHKTAVTQVMADSFDSFPECFVKALESIAPRLEYLSLISLINKMRTILPACRNLRQLHVFFPDGRHLSTIAQLPHLTHLKLAKLSLGEVASFLMETKYGSVAPELLFPSLRHLSIEVSTPPEDSTRMSKGEELVELLALMPPLEGLFLTTQEGISLHVLRSVRTDRLTRLSISDQYLTAQGVTAICELLSAMPNLERLYLARRVFESSVLQETVLLHLPRLRVLGPVQRSMGMEVFSVWRQMGKRYLRWHDHAGYFDDSPVKPFDEFVAFLKDNIDTRHPVQRITQDTLGGGDVAAGDRSSASRNKRVIRSPFSLLTRAAGMKAD
eukprot:Rhum_TRINITY_DN13397_c0_g1::Rhum_TRINITY_DN13397_c0_g1_i1::g.58911::m.58911